MVSKIFIQKIMISLLLIGSFSLSMSTGCEQFYAALLGESKADIEHPQEHSDERVQFKYPGNWSLTTDRQLIEGQTLMSRQIKSSGSALTIIQSFPPLTLVPLDLYLENFLQGMSEELDSGWKQLIKHTQNNATKIHRKVLGKSCEGRRFDWNIKVLNEETPFLVEIISVPHSKGVIYVITQIPIKEADKVQPGINLILDSLSELPQH